MIKILDPTTSSVGSNLMLAPRYQRINGLRLGVLWNGRPFGAKIIPRVVEILKEKFSIVMVDYLAKKYFGNVAPKEMFDQLAGDKAEAVLVGVGD